MSMRDARPDPRVTTRSPQALAAVWPGRGSTQEEIMLHKALTTLILALLLMLLFFPFSWIP